MNTLIASSFAGWERGEEGTGVRTHWPYLTIWLLIDTFGQMEEAIRCAYYLIFRRLTALHYGILSAHVNKAEVLREIEGANFPWPLTSNSASRRIPKLS